MKIIAGKTKGRVIGHDKSADLRPTAAKVRESVFNIIRDRIEGSRFLDLFAGTGAVGVEALSRGAERVTFVEISKRRVNKIKQVVDSFGFSRVATVVCGDVLSFLRKGETARYDIVFADPPYDYEALDELSTLIDDAGILAKDGILLIEHASTKSCTETTGSLHVVKTYRYGDTTISKFRFMPESTEE